MTGWQPVGEKMACCGVTRDCVKQFEGDTGVQARFAVRNRGAYAPPLDSAL